MAKKLVFFIACINALAVLARDCSRLENINNCNDCFRCGAKWCRKSGNQRCVMVPPDDWCSGDIESPPISADKVISINGSLVEYSYVEMTATIGHRAAKYITYESKEKLKVDYNIINSTQNKAFVLEHDVTCDDANCKIRVDAMPDENFCSERSDEDESVNVKLTIDGIEESIHLKYHVPCACQCSKEIERKSTTCKIRGDLVCGACTCENGWEGEFCETKKPERGDNPCTSYWNNKECSGNGYCDYRNCVCHKDVVGHQYMSPDEFCADICLTTSRKYDSCLHNLAYGAKECPDDSELRYKRLNETLLNEKDEDNRMIWIKCTETIDGCEMEYATMKEGDWADAQQNIMVIKSCNPEVGAFGGTTNIYVPVILGILGVVLAGVAVAGYVAWKNRPPPLPLTDNAGYTNINAEDCVGENPLYKPPTSSFKNPTYGKW